MQLKNKARGMLEVKTHNKLKAHPNKKANVVHKDKSAKKDKGKHNKHKDINAKKIKLAAKKIK